VPCLPTDFLRPEEHHYEAASPVLTRAAKVTANEPADSGYETTEGWHKSGTWSIEGQRKPDKTSFTCIF